ncbi:MAG TPA: hypothetical protein VK638_26595 [Edaphobacter sp.]|nr:hypothetical protein [Edaphobacter sp.]
MKSFAQLLFFFLMAFGISATAWAHVGNKDVFETVNAGPYRLFVTVRPPNVIPGVATIEVRTSGSQVNAIKIAPVPLTGEASKHPPTPDAMKVSTADPAFFTGSLWLMAQGSWQVRFEVDGAGGSASAGVPVPAIPLSVLSMNRSLGILLGVLGLILSLGMIGIVSAAVRESRLAPGTQPTPSRRRKALMASVAALVVVVLTIYAGNSWWKVEAAGYTADIYHPTDLQAMLTGNKLDLTVGRYSEKRRQDSREDSLLKKDELLLDHGHLMHLYAIRQPEMDAVFHLHPEPVSDKHLGMTLPAMPPGKYKLYADIVHMNGFPETLTADLIVPEGMSAAPLASEDASAQPLAISQGELGAAYELPDGYSMVWDRPKDLNANAAYSFRFRLVDANGKPATDMQPYLGMAGHAAFVKDDGTTFAHTHPDGSAAMPAMMLANNDRQEMTDMPGMEMPTSSAPISSTVGFPYGFPSPGRYRIFIQMKHGGTVETGVFDADVR